MQKPKSIRIYRHSSGKTVVKLPNIVQLPTFKSVRKKSVINLPRHGFGNESCRLKTTLSTNRLILLPSEPRTNNSQSCVNPSGDALFLSDAEWPISSTILIRILLHNHRNRTRNERNDREREREERKNMQKLSI